MFAPTSSRAALEVSKARFLRAWASARRVSETDPLLARWSYSPWFAGKLTAAGQRLSFAVYLGGLGTLRDPAGRVVHFMLDAKLLAGTS